MLALVAFFSRRSKFEEVLWRKVKREGGAVFPRPGRMGGNETIK